MSQTQRIVEWVHSLRCGQRFHVSEVVRDTGVTPGSASGCMVRLMRSGDIIRVGSGMYERTDVTAYIPTGRTTPGGKPGRKIPRRGSDAEPTDSGGDCVWVVLSVSGLEMMAEERARGEALRLTRDGAGDQVVARVTMMTSVSVVERQL